MTEQLKLDDGEDIIRVVRKHWFVLFTKTIGLLAAAALPLIALSFLTSNDIFLSVAPDPHLWLQPAIFLSAAWLLIIWMTLFTIWTDYYLDCWVLTDRRIITIDQRGFFNRQVASFRLERLQNITVHINGLIQTLLDFGNIDADTAAGHKESFVIRGVPNPRDIKALIQECADKILKNMTTPMQSL